MPAVTLSNCSLSCCSSARDRKSTRLNSSHVAISYAVFCLKKKDISVKLVAGGATVDTQFALLPMLLHLLRITPQHPLEGDNTQRIRTLGCGARASHRMRLH